MEWMVGSPWDFGTGNALQLGMGGMPAAPPVDLASIMAQGMASKGIRPEQFFSNPTVAQEALQPPPPMQSEWDPTPVAMPEGPAMRPMMPQAPTNATPLPTGAAEASAAGSPAEKKAAGEKSMSEKFAEGLKGVKAPTPPAAQTVKTPSAPEPKGTIKTGELLSLLLTLGPSMDAGLKLPPTLGQSLKGVYG